MMSETQARKLQLFKFVQPTTTRFYTSSGKLERAMGILVDVPITIGSFTMPTDVYVSHADSYNLLIGNNFLAAAEASIHYGTRELWVRKGVDSYEMIDIDFQNSAPERDPYPRMNVVMADDEHPAPSFDIDEWNAECTALAALCVGESLDSAGRLDNIDWEALSSLTDQVVPTNDADLWRWPTAQQPDMVDDWDVLLSSEPDHGHASLTVMEGSAFAPYLHLLKPDHSIHSPYLYTPTGWISLAQVWQEEVLVRSVDDIMEKEPRWPEYEELDDCQPDLLELTTEEVTESFRISAFSSSDAEPWKVIDPQFCNPCRMLLERIGNHPHLHIM